MIDAALAQAPNIQATADAATAFYLNQGVLGATVVVLLLLLVVCGLVIRHLYNDIKALNAQICEKFARALTTVEASTTALVESRGTLQSLGAAIEALGKAVGQLSHENETHDREVRHSFGNAMHALAGIADKLKEIGGRLDDARNRFERIREP